MDFFKDMTKHPQERRQNAAWRARQKAEAKKAQEDLIPNQKILPEVRSGSLSLFQLSLASNSNWEETLHHLGFFKSVAFKSNSPEDVVTAAEAHALAYAKYVQFLDESGTGNLNFSNTTFHWWQVLEDLSDLYVIARHININPEALSAVLEVLSLIDSYVLGSGLTDSELDQWRTSRETTRLRFPALPSI